MNAFGGSTAMGVTPHFAAVVAGLVLVLGGCDAPVGTALIQSQPLQQTQTVSSDRYVIDAGIVFADQESYRCYPLSQFGVESAALVASVTSSCECLRPRLVGYHQNETQVADALRIDFVAGSDGNDNSPARLLVEMVIRQIDGGREMPETISVPVKITSAGTTYHAELAIDVQGGR